MKNRLLYIFLLNSINIFSLDNYIKEIEPIESIHSDNETSNDDNINNEENISNNFNKRCVLWKINYLIFSYIFFY